MGIKICAIIVTHNSSKDLGAVIACLRRQKHVLLRIIIVDSGSDDQQYIEACSPDRLIRMSNVGFAKANNEGATHVGDDEYLALVNPDLYLLDEHILFTICSRMPPKKNAFSTALLLGFDSSQMKPTGLIDSAGLEFGALGFARDRAQGLPAAWDLSYQRKPFGACGAFVVYTPSVLPKLRGIKNTLFWERLWTYKEDVEMSIRLRSIGIDFYYYDDLIAYHCRGWKSNDRYRNKYRIRLISARNDFYIDCRHRIWHLPIAIIKLAMAAVGI